MPVVLYMDNMTSPQPSARVRQVPALSRGIAVLRLLGQGEEALGVQAIARALNLVPSTALHILRVLAAEGLVAVDPTTKKYRVAAGLVALARGALRQNSLAALAQPELELLSRTYRSTAIAVEASGLRHMVVVALAREASPLRVHVDIGSRFPALISATGRCVAAFGAYPWPEIEARFHALRWDAGPTLDVWRAEVEAARRLGYAVDRGQYIRGVAIVAAPVRMADGVVNALVVVGVRDQLEEVGLDRIGETLRERAGRLSAAIGG